MTESLAEPSALPRSTRLQSIAQRLDCTEGQLYTLAIGLVVALPLAIFGVPPTLRDQPAALADSGQQTPPVVVPQPSAQPPVVVPPPTQPSFGPLTPVPGPGVGVPTDGFPEPSSEPAPGQPEPPSALPPGTISLLARVGSPGHPAGLAVHRNGSYTVTTNNGSTASVALTYGPRGELRRRTVIAGQPADHKTGLVAAATTPTGQVVMLDTATNRVLIMPDAGGTPTVRATVQDVSPCLLTLGVQPCEQTLPDQPVSLAAVAVDKRGTIYVADAGQGIIWRLRAADKTPQAWYRATDLDTGDGPAGLAFDRNGRLLFTTGSSLDTANPNNGNLYRLAIAADSTAGSRTLVYAFATTARPGAVVVGASGTSYVVARGPGAIVSISSTGKEIGRVGPPGKGSVPLDSPASLALTNGRLLVTNEAPLAPQNWAVLAITVNDRA